MVLQSSAPRSFGGDCGSSESPQGAPPANWNDERNIFFFFGFSHFLYIIQVYREPVENAKSGFIRQFVYLCLI